MSYSKITHGNNFSAAIKCEISWFEAAGPITKMAISQYLSQLLVLVVWGANLPFTIGTSCNADNVLRAIRSEGEVGVLDCLDLFSIPVSEWKISYVFITVSELLTS